MINIAIGSDHAGFPLKSEIIKYFSGTFGFCDFGTYSSQPADYPEFGHFVAQSVALQKCEFGIVVCGSGNGINMTVNKYDQVRSALCWSTTIAELARLHNNANILALPGRFITLEEGLEIVKIFMETEFEGGKHLRRIGKISIKSNNIHK